MNELPLLIDELRAAATDVKRFDSLIVAITNQHGETGLAALFTVPELPADADDAMWSLTHAVESLPDAAYIAALLGGTSEMSKVCPTFMEFLWRRTLRSEQVFTATVTRLPCASIESRRVLRELFEKVERDPKTSPLLRERCGHALTQMSTE